MWLECEIYAFRQIEIEMGNRVPVGLWLREHGQPQETVYTEPLGYIGYFSGMRMIDWPGSSRRKSSRRDVTRG